MSPSVEPPADAWTPAVPRDAATVLLLRDVAETPTADRRAVGAGPVEVYLLRRVKGMPFAGGMTAYPGGAVDRRDTDVDLAWTGPEPAAWAASFGCPVPLARALVCAAVRETFEESGVLLASPTGGDVVVAEDTEWEARRRGLLDRTLSLGELLADQGLTLRADLLRPWAHWITPEPEPRRYDARFFVAALPPGVRARDVSGEADEAVWITPAAALAEFDHGDRPMLTPTVHTLRQVAGFGSVAEILAAAPVGRLEEVTPRLEYDGDDEYVVLLDGSRTRTPMRLGRNRSVL